MILETFHYQPSKGFSCSTFPALDSPSTAVILFAAPEFLAHPEPITQVARAYPQSMVVGCSTSGEVYGSEVRDGSLSIAVLKLEHGSVKAAFAPVSNADESRAAGEILAENLQAPDLKGVFVLADGLKVNGSDLVRGINKSLKSQVLVSGGLAGDGPRFQKSFVIRDGLPLEGMVSALGFYGENVRIGHGSRGGWDIFGPERRITKSKGNVLFEIDGKPALALYKEYLGERAKELPGSALLFPLQVRASDPESPKVVRTVLSVDEAAQSMTFAGDMPAGNMAQLMRANFERLISGAAQSAVLASADWSPAEPALAIAVSCVGRRLVLGERVEEETEAALNALPEGTRQVGFYSYGEISSTSQQASCELHNQTMTYTLISETR